MDDNTHFVLILAAVAVAVGILSLLPRIDGRAKNAGDAYILVKGDAATAQWNYQQLPMRDCAWCRRTVNLNRHHIVPQAANPSLRDVRTNLVVLCRDCHFVLGHRCDWKRYNPDVLYICENFTNCVWSADTRRGNDGRTGRDAGQETGMEPVSTNNLERSPIWDGKNGSERATAPTNSPDRTAPPGATTDQGPGSR